MTRKFQIFTVKLSFAIKAVYLFQHESQTMSYVESYCLIYALFYFICKHVYLSIFITTGDLVCRAMHYQQSRQQPPSNMNHKPCLTWSPSALHALFYYMKCCQLEYSDNPNVDPPAMQLNPERYMYVANCLFIVCSSRRFMFVKLFLLKTIVTNTGSG